jgi:uncharacterized protein YndB with AHSA1/START domain
VAEYAFESTWVVEAPIEKVWAVLEDREHWRDWFPGLREVRELEPGDSAGAGAVLEAVVRASLPYELAFRARITRVEPPRLLELTALGDLEGSGRGTLAEEDGVTTVRFEWRVATTKPWMNALAPVARPVFGLNHHLLMRSAGSALARRLGARLLANESGPAERQEGRAATVAVVAVLLLAGTAAVLGRRRTPRG